MNGASGSRSVGFRVLRTPGALRNGVLLGAAALSGGLLSLAYALTPFWPAAWLAPIPLLLVAMSTRWPVALGFGSLAGVIGSLSLLGYMADLGGPVDAVLTSLVRAVQWAVVALVARVAARLPVPVGVFVIPALFAGLEVLIAVASPHGSAGSLAYSQMDALPVIQIASVGGTAAIAFLLGVFANVVAYAVLGRPKTWRALLAPVMILVLSLGYGMWRLAEAPAHTGPRVALITTDRFTGVPDDWRTVWETYESAIHTAAERGAQLAVLPEKVFRIGAGDVSSFLTRAAGLARTTGIDIVIGVDERGDVAHNRAYLIRRNGDVTTYDKRHLIPGLESPFTPGTTDVIATAAGTPLALLICKDLDFPQTIASAASGAALLVVPAWDFTEDGWFHSRLAILRGVENGVPVARTARDGLLTLSDPYGRILIETASNPTPQIAIGDATAPATQPTPYAVIRDTFGWTALIFTSGALLIVGIRSRIPKPRDRPPVVTRKPGGHPS